MKSAGPQVPRPLDGPLIFLCRRAAVLDLLGDGRGRPAAFFPHYFPTLVFKSPSRRSRTRRRHLSSRRTSSRIRSGTPPRSRLPWRVLPSGGPACRPLRASSIPNPVPGRPCGFRREHVRRTADVAIDGVDAIAQARVTIWPRPRATHSRRDLRPAARRGRRHRPSEAVIDRSFVGRGPPGGFRSGPAARLRSARSCPSVREAARVPIRPRSRRPARPAGGPTVHPVRPARARCLADRRAEIDRPRRADGRRGADRRRGRRRGLSAARRFAATHLGLPLGRRCRPRETDEAPPGPPVRPGRDVGD